jgi:hypothetical protein
MKKLVAVGFIIIFTLVGLSAAAEESEYYVKSVIVTKVYPHQDGYRIVYQRENLKLGVVYLPMDWFYTDGGARKAQVIYGEDPAYPYLSIFWRQGEFHHLRLYVNENKNHPTWGDLENYPGLGEKFNVDTLQMEF